MRVNTEPGKAHGVTRSSVTKGPVSSPATTLLGLRAEVLADLLPLLTVMGDGRELGHYAAVSVNRVLAQAWNDDRLTECRLLLAAGEKAPAVHLSRYWLHGQAFYVVCDGMHRTTAAREAGRQRIWARIDSESWCKPEQHWLEVATGRLWQEVQPGGQVLSLVRNGVEAELAAALLAVGVHER